LPVRVLVLVPVPVPVLVLVVLVADPLLLGLHRFIRPAPPAFPPAASSSVCFSPPFALLPY
jgi:hypothetical protein